MQWWECMEPAETRLPPGATRALSVYIDLSVCLRRALASCVVAFSAENRKSTFPENALNTLWLKVGDVHDYLDRAPVRFSPRPGWARRAQELRRLRPCISDTSS